MVLDAQHPHDVAKGRPLLDLPDKIGLYLEAALCESQTLQHSHNLGDAILEVGDLGPQVVLCAPYPVLVVVSTEGGQMLSPSRVRHDNLAPAWEA
ncbi:hypothetical protein S40285_10940 [Stachybotrys chlorohalonatus IBT 40285]|uniref:Uncharacterized protein n=1 Tax=Stachybotrys chlorohalonatus (strain IBT 40285) TaxID=1283841 RepID=A0A084Q895_STAC4|nr:hypothetical protein S40285_10940 [Stachybotrys chlorohalonata IBT 40285]